MQVSNKIKVLIVDDVLVIRNMLENLLLQDDRFEVCAKLGNGKEAVEYLKTNKPDVISMDIHMPVMDGFAATAAIMQQNPVPIVIVSSSYEPQDVHHSFKALEAGAVSIIMTPCGPGHPLHSSTSSNYITTLKLMSEVKVVRRTRTSSPTLATKPTDSPTLHMPGEGILNQTEIIVIGASAGGPYAIQTILAGLRKDFPIPILIVQHIDPNFAPGFVEWLALHTSLSVRSATDGEVVKPSHVYLSPGDQHIGFKHKGTLQLSTISKIKSSFRPSVAHLFLSTAECYACNAIGILLSGMGTDGAAELKNMRSKGALTIVQDIGSSLVYGMPGEALKIDRHHLVLSPEQIIQILNNKQS